MAPIRLLLADDDGALLADKSGHKKYSVGHPTVLLCLMATPSCDS
jgi:hypothetical protein